MHQNRDQWRLRLKKDAILLRVVLARNAFAARRLLGMSFALSLAEVYVQHHGLPVATVLLACVKLREGHPPSPSRQTASRLLGYKKAADVLFLALSAVSGAIVVDPPFILVPPCF